MSQKVSPSLSDAYLLVGYTIQVCVSTLYDVRTMTKLPNDACLRKYPRR